MSHGSRLAKTKVKHLKSIFYFCYRTKCVSSVFFLCLFLCYMFYKVFKYHPILVRGKIIFYNFAEEID
jgi:hypothetical protein